MAVDMDVGMDVSAQAASATLRRRERMYRDFMEFFELAERNRRWNPMNDIPWELLESAQMQQTIADGNRSGNVDSLEKTAICLETFCGVELFIPDYTKNGLCVSREIFGQAWFHLSWGYEESKHALVLREYLLRSGLRTLEQYLQFEQEVLKKQWHMPFLTNREMACYGAMQEIATYLIYANQRAHYRAVGNKVLARLFDLICRDEAAHATFYRKLMRFELEEDPEGATGDLAHVIANFEMPGAQLLPNFQERLAVEGVGISKQLFLERAIMPTLKAFGMTRRDLLKGKQRRALRDQLAKRVAD